MLIMVKAKLVLVHKTMIVKTVQVNQKMMVGVEIEDCLIIVGSQKSYVALKAVVVRQNMMG